MNLGEFHDLVREEVNKGSSLDGVIPAKVQQAARWIERNNTLKYMERFATASLADRCWSFPTSRVKAFLFIRYEARNGKFHYIPQVAPQEVASVSVGIPDGFWIDADDHVWFDAFPAQGNLELEIMTAEYSEWPTADAGMHWLIDNAQDVLISQTMMLLAPTARENEWLTTYKSMKEEGLRTLALADEELRHSARNEVMRYG